MIGSRQQKARVREVKKLDPVYTLKELKRDHIIKSYLI